MRVRHPGEADGSQAGVRTGGSEMILLVDDEPDVRVCVRAMLEYGGYRVVEAAGGHPAVEWMERHGSVVDLLLTDVCMPGMSGPDLARRTRELRPDLQVLFMSGHFEEPAPGQEATVDARFIMKPFTGAVLLREVRDLLDAAVALSPAAADSPG